MSAVIWESIQFVVGGFSLVAFVAAAIAWVLRSKIDERARLIREAQPVQRAALVSQALDSFAVETGALTRQQQYDVVMAQIAQRSHRFIVVAKVITFTAVLLAGVTVYAISQVHTMLMGPTSPQLGTNDPLQPKPESAVAPPQAVQQPSRPPTPAARLSPQAKPADSQANPPTRPSSRPGQLGTQPPGGPETPIASGTGNGAPDYAPVTVIEKVNP